MDKFYKTYSIRFDIGDIDYGREKPINVEETIYVTYPLTAEFAIGRSISAGTNSAMVKIYGLGETKRRLLYKDPNDITKYILMTVYAGYNDNLYAIYRGTVQECYSVRNGGATEYQTIINSTDCMLDMFLGKTSRSYDKGATTEDKIRGIAGDLMTLELAKISQNINFTKSKRSQNLTGKTLSVLRDISLDDKGKQTMSVDDGKIYFLNENDIVDDLGILEIDCDRGLLGSPRRRNNYITAELLFEPQAMLNQMAILNSKTVPWLNQAYKIMAVSHNGLISGTKDSALTTTIDLFFGVGEWFHV